MAETKMNPSGESHTPISPEIQALERLQKLGEKEVYGTPISELLECALQRAQALRQLVWAEQSFYQAQDPAVTDASRIMAQAATQIKSALESLEGIEYPEKDEFAFRRHTLAADIARASALKAAIERWRAAQGRQGALEASLASIERAAQGRQSVLETLLASLEQAARVRHKALETSLAAVEQAAQERQKTLEASLVSLEQAAQKRQKGLERQWEQETEQIRRWQSFSQYVRDFGQAISQPSFQKLLDEAKLAIDKAKANLAEWPAAEPPSSWKKTAEEVLTRMEEQFQQAQEQHANARLATATYWLNRAEAYLPSSSDLDETSTVAGQVTEDEPEQYPLSPSASSAPESIRAEGLSSDTSAPQLSTRPSGQFASLDPFAALACLARAKVILDDLQEDLLGTTDRSKQDWQKTLPAFSDTERRSQEGIWEGAKRLAAELGEKAVQRLPMRLSPTKRQKQDWQDAPSEFSDTDLGLQERVRKGTKRLVELQERAEQYLPNWLSMKRQLQWKQTVQDLKGKLDSWQSSHPTEDVTQFLGKTKEEHKEHRELVDKVRFYLYSARGFDELDDTLQKLILARQDNLLWARQLLREVKAHWLADEQKPQSRAYWALRRLKKAEEYDPDSREIAALKEDVIKIWEKVQKEFGNSIRQVQSCLGIIDKRTADIRTRPDEVKRLLEEARQLLDKAGGVLDNQIEHPPEWSREFEAIASRLKSLQEQYNRVQKLGERWRQSEVISLELIEETRECLTKPDLPASIKFLIIEEALKERGGYKHSHFSQPSHAIECAELLSSLPS